MPINLYGAVGAFIDQPVICSGKTGWHEPTDTNICLKYDLETSEWFEFARLNQARSEAAAIVFNSGTMWITGGFNSALDSELSTTELVKTNGEVTVGNELLHKLRGHCMLLTSEAEQRVFVIGGRDGSSSPDRVQIYSVIGDNAFYVEDGPVIKGKRWNHGCAFYKQNGRDIAVVAGGEGRNGPVLFLEAWDYQQSPYMFDSM